MIVHHILWLDNMNEKTLKISPSLLYLDLYVHPSVPFTYIGMVSRANFIDSPFPCHYFIKRVNKKRKFWKYIFWYVLVWWFLIHSWCLWEGKCHIMVIDDPQLGKVWLSWVSTTPLLHNYDQSLGKPFYVPSKPLLEWRLDPCICIMAYGWLAKGWWWWHRTLVSENKHVCCII